MLSCQRVQGLKPSQHPEGLKQFRLHAGRHTSATLFSSQTFLQEKASRVLIAPTPTPPQLTYLLPKPSVACDDTHRVHLDDQQCATEQEGRQYLAVLHHLAQSRHLG